MVNVEFFFYLDKYRFSIRASTQKEPSNGGCFIIPVINNLNCTVIVDGIGASVGYPPVYFCAVKIKKRDEKVFLNNLNSSKWKNEKVG